MKIAVIGGGVSGLTAAHLLSDEHEVHVFEARERIGGHTHTYEVEGPDGSHAVDTGFIVFNDWTYPNFIKLMERLEIQSQPSDMSFSVKVEETGLEYNPSDIDRLFVQRRNLLVPGFHRMWMDILRFNKECLELLEGQGPGPSLGEYLAAGKYSERFIEHYILPMGCAIWSSGTDAMRRFPARYFVEFFRNHGMLSVNDRPTWRVLKGGSSSYLEPLCKPFRETMHLATPVTSVRRFDEKVEVIDDRGQRALFDHVVIAAHADQALMMLADPSDDERRLLSAVPYQANDVVLHTDSSVLPKNPKAWAAWNYLVPEDGTQRATLTYNMNILQSLEAQETYCVSVNPGATIDPAKVIERFSYSHPVFTPEGVDAQTKYDRIGGVRNTHYAGAYWSFGFHEDGVKSGLRVAQAFGKSL